MKIIFDFQTFVRQKYGGVSRYFVEIIKSLRELNHECEIPILLHKNNYLDKSLRINYKNNYAIKAVYELNKAYSEFRISSEDFDILHPTFYDPYYLTVEKPVVVTIHDMIHEKFPQYFPKDDLTAKWKYLSMKNASKIIAVSENTKKDIIQIHGFKDHDIEVIYHGCSLNKPENGVDLNLPDRYVLFVGKRDGYKNFQALLNAFKNIQKEYDNIFLVCVGGGKFSKEENTRIQDLGVSEKILQFSPTDKSIPAFYQQAEAFVYPSLYEGFGIPILEAYKFNCPVICSNSSCFPEIAKDAAIYFKAESVDSLTNHLTQLLQSQDLKEVLITKGKKRLRDFSWEKTALETLNIYKEVKEKAES